MERRCGCLRPVSRARVAKGAKIAREKKSQERVSGRQRQSLKILLKMKRAHGEGETKRWRESSVVVEVRKRRKIDNMKYCFTPHKSWCRFMGIEIPGRGKSLFVERVPKVSFHHVRVARSLSLSLGILINSSTRSRSRVGLDYIVGAAAAARRWLSDHKIRYERVRARMGAVCIKAKREGKRAWPSIELFPRLLFISSPWNARPAHCVVYGFIWFIRR